MDRSTEMSDILLTVCDGTEDHDTCFGCRWLMYFEEIELHKCARFSNSNCYGYYKTLTLQEDPLILHYHPDDDPIPVMYNCYESIFPGKRFKRKDKGTASAQETGVI